MWSEAFGTYHNYINVRYDESLKLSKYLKFLYSTTWVMLYYSVGFVVSLLKFLKKAVSFLYQHRNHNLDSFGKALRFQQSLYIRRIAVDKRIVKIDNIIDISGVRSKNLGI
jgi:uncharacterized membrane protein YcgQ (UPF0703/DUF1980 family)